MWSFLHCFLPSAERDDSQAVGWKGTGLVAATACPVATAAANSSSPSESSICRDDARAAATEASQSQPAEAAAPHMQQDPLQRAATVDLDSAAAICVVPLLDCMGQGLFTLDSASEHHVQQHHWGVPCTSSRPPQPPARSSLRTSTAKASSPAASDAGPRRSLLRPRHRVMSDSNLPAIAHLTELPNKEPPPLDASPLKQQRADLSLIELLTLAFTIDEAVSRGLAPASGCTSGALSCGLLELSRSCSVMRHASHLMLSTSFSCHSSGSGMPSGKLMLLPQSSRNFDRAATSSLGGMVLLEV